MSNQAHVQVHELTLERRRWETVKELLVNFCSTNSIEFVERITAQRLKLCTKDKILATWMFDLVPPSFDDLDTACQNLGKKLYILVDHWVDASKFNYSNIVVYALPELLGLTYLDNTLEYRESKKHKLYNAFIHRTESTRQSWFYFLHLNNLLNQGYVSYNLYQIKGDLTGVDLFDRLHEEFLSEVPAFTKAYQELRSLVPFKNFKEKSNLAEYILDSKYSLVLDTYAPEDDHRGYYISEKVTRALQYPSINLLFLQKNTIQHLVDSGFEIDQDVTGFDNLNWIQRQQAILEILKGDTIHIEYDKLYNQALHNRQIMLKWFKQCANGSVFEEIFNHISND